jgi:hypothetical protein
MFRTKTLVILALMLFTLVTPVLATHADDEAESVGTASVQDDQATNDSVIISLTGISPAGPGSSYLASLVSADGETILELGTASVSLPVVHGVVQGTGTMDLVFGSGSANYDGANLLASFSRIKITEEPAGTSIYSDALPGDAVDEIKEMLDDIASLNSALDTAITSAQSAQAESDTDGINSHINAVVAAIAGVGSLSDSINAHAVAAGGVATDESGITDGVTGIATMTSNINGWTAAVKETSEDDILSQSSAAVAQIFVDKVVNDLSAARNGWDADNSGSVDATAGEGGSAQAYSVGQGMATFTLIAGDLPAPEGETVVVVVPVATPTPVVVEEEEEVVVVVVETPQHILELGLPSVGQQLLGAAMQVSFIFGLLLIGFSGLILVRSRR